MSITGTDVMWTELNDTLFFDFSATSIENYPFTDSDLDALRNLAVLIDTAKVLDQMHEKKPLRRDLIDFINIFLSVVVGGNPLPSGDGRSLIDCRYRAYVL